MTRTVQFLQHDTLTVLSVLRLGCWCAIMFDITVTFFSLRVLWTTFVYVYFHWILYFRGFSKEYIAVGDLLVSSTLEVYKNAMANLLPTPAKSHYLFNLRDFARVIQGTLLSTPDIIEDPDNLKRHWAHEVRNQLLLIGTCFIFTGGRNFEWTW